MTAPGFLTVGRDRVRADLVLSYLLSVSGTRVLAVETKHQSYDAAPGIPVEDFERDLRTALREVTQ